MFSWAKKYIFKIFLLLYQAMTLQCNFFLKMKNMKKQPSKVAHNSQPAVFFINCLAAQKAHFGQKLEFYGLSVPPLYNLLDLSHNFYNFNEIYRTSE